MTRWLIPFALVFTLACETGGSNKAPDKAPEASAEETKKEATEPPKTPDAKAPDAKAPDAKAPESAPAAKDDDACVKACVQKNQMRAVAADQIERDCRAECAQNK